MALLVLGVLKRTSKATKVAGLLCQMKTAYINGAKDQYPVVFG
tara:strand:+ start:850 stop:978 length:129 start_codon:yes stop_codon:yes gene_type:complete